MASTHEYLDLLRTKSVGKMLLGKFIILKTVALCVMDLYNSNLSCVAFKTSI